ncbi:unnamed protein product, partial [marine sediment metagenome]
IKPGAFSKTLKDGTDIFAVWNHDTSAVLGRRKNGTLQLLEDDHGLHIEISPPDTPTAQEVRELIRQGFVDKMSFCFDVVKEVWTDNGDEGVDLREIKEVKLYEVSPVLFPAYDGTTVTARGCKPERPRELKQKAEPGPAPHSLDIKRRRLDVLLKQT